MNTVNAWRKNIRHAGRGMSLIEIMLVMTIVAGVMVAAIQLFRSISNRMKVESTKTILRAVKTGIEQYKIDLGHYPAKIDELVNAPSDQNDRRRWQGPYVPEEYAKGGSIRDSYNHEVEYKFDATKQSFELFAWGKNGPGQDVGNIFVD